ncbi:MAG TPA: FMN-binding protein [Phycisphaerae bacterium]|nr:FMN-binding protein [Phycisphaerae bacterium]
MKYSKLYAVAFTVVLCGSASGVLTFAQAAWSGRIEANRNFGRVRAIADAFGLLGEGMGRGEVIAAYHAAVTPARKGEMDYYEARRGGRLIGYAMEIAGRGRYGPIKGILAFGPARRTLLNLRIFEQNETPGLGGRIASSDWLGQFSGKPAGPAGLVFSETASGPNVIWPVSGASKTMYSLSRLVNQAVARFLAGGADLAELDLGLTADTVTKATPGYPKNQPTPPHLRQEVKRPPFMVPKGGTVNLALNRPVTGSIQDDPIIGELSQITDGVLKSGQFDYVEIDPGPQWVQVDLGDVHTIYAVVVWHFYKNPVIYRDVIVQASRDKDFKTGVVTLFNNDHDDSSGQGKGADTAYYARWWGEIADARGDDQAGTRCRYVRVWTHGGTADEDTRFVEIAVYGRPSK